jgi:hypothetical protein
MDGWMDGWMDGRKTWSNGLIGAFHKLNINFRLFYYK